MNPQLLSDNGDYRFGLLKCGHELPARAYIKTMLYVSIE